MSMNYVRPGQATPIYLQGGDGTAFPTGGVGTYGVRIEDGANNVVVARSTALTEIGVGIYLATITWPETEGTYLAIWDDGAGVDVADGDLYVVAYTAASNVPGPGLITADDLDARRITYTDVAQAEAAIADASAVARSYVAPIFDAVDTPDAPDVVVAIVCGMVRRLLVNPVGLAQETLGDYSYQAGSNGIATLLPTAREKKMLRQAAAAYATTQVMDIPAWGAGGVQMQTELPAEYEDDLADLGL